MKKSVLFKLIITLLLLLVIAVGIYGFIHYDIWGRLGLPRDNVNSDSLQSKLEQIIQDNGSGIEDIYDFVRSNIRYKRIDKTTPDEMVLYALNYRRGACYHFAYLTEYLLKTAGYEAITIYGLGLDTDGDGIRDASEHYWNMIKLDGVWYHYDTLQGRYLLSDSEMLELGYSWNQEEFPKAD